MIRESPQQLADEVRHLTADIPRDVSPARMPKGKSITEDELLHALRTKDDPEISLLGLLARVKLLESQMRKVMARK